MDNNNEKEKNYYIDNLIKIYDKSSSNNIYMKNAIFDQNLYLSPVLNPLIIKKSSNITKPINQTMDRGKILNKPLILNKGTDFSKSPGELQISINNVCI